MKKFLSGILFLLFLFPLNAQYKEDEKFEVYQTKITLCSYKNKSYILIQNSYNDIQQSLVIYSDDKYKVEQVYGEILISYYSIKHAKKECQYYNGERFYVTVDNMENEKKFLMNLTNNYFLKKYKTFFFIDNNYSKDEDVTFYDFEDNSEKENSIGSSAGILMGIKSSDFIEAIKEIKRESE